MHQFKYILAIFNFIACFSYAQVLQTSNGPVEIIGLTSWSPQQLLDTVSVISPNIPIPACAAILKNKLGFPGAAVVGHFYNGGLYTLITIVEPKDSALVKYKNSYKDTLATIQQWSNAFDLFDSHPNDFFMALQYYPARSIDSIYSHISSFTDSSVVLKTWQTMEQYNTEKDKQIAISALRYDGNHRNRIVSAGVMANFFNSDSTWCELVDALRDPDDRVSGVAGAILLKQVKTLPRPVDWSDAIFSLRAVLDGTNLFAFAPAMEILSSTKVSPKLAPPLLKEGGNLILLYLNANLESARQLAHSFLVQIAGRDLGTDVSVWRSWIDSL